MERHLFYHFRRLGSMADMGHFGNYFMGHFGNGFLLPARTKGLSFLSISFGFATGASTCPWRA